MRNRTFFLQPIMLCVVAKQTTKCLILLHLTRIRFAYDKKFVTDGTSFVECDIKKGLVCSLIIYLSILWEECAVILQGISPP